MSLAKPNGADDASSTPWVVSAKVAAHRIAHDSPTVLDVRKARAFARGHVPGAVRVDWQQFSQPDDPNRGKLLEPEKLQLALRAVGVRSDHPVIVVGNPRKGWGEDGRIVWMLRASGHHDAALVDGGQRALAKAGVKMTKKKTVAKTGNFVVHPQPSLTAIRDDVRAASHDSHSVIIDTRELREYRGATPYGESRGGHVPSAKHLYYRDLLTKKGFLLDPAKIRARLAKLGAKQDTPIIAYCTGGIRSGWLVVVLHNAGFTHVRNYAGSMWGYSSAPAGEYPLER